jgi:hypothetical protein
VGGSAPKLTSLIPPLILPRVVASVALVCPVQANPVPVFRLAIKKTNHSVIIQKIILKSKITMYQKLLT